MEKKLLAIVVLVMIASLLVGGCTSSTTNTGTYAVSTNATTNTSANVTVTSKASPLPTITAVIQPLPAASLTPISTANPTATPSSTPTPIQTSVVILDMPIAIGHDMPIGATFSTNPPSLTVNVYINGVYVGSAKANGQSGNFEFGEQLPYGQHYSLTLEIAGNAQYAPSSTTGYFNVVTYLTSAANGG
jgi:hypothetical protein